MKGQGFEHVAALVEGHAAKRGIAYGPGIVNGCSHVDAAGAGLCKGYAGDRIEQGLTFSFSGDPFSLYVVLQLFHDRL